MFQATKEIMEFIVLVYFPDTAKKDDDNINRGYLHK
jgi:hypothetical protein